MSNSDRLKEILARGAADAERRAKAAAAADEASQERQRVKEKAAAAWAEKKATFENRLKIINEGLIDFGKSLFFRLSKSGDPARIEMAAVSFYSDVYYESSSIQKAAIVIMSNGKIGVRIGSQNQSPVRQYELDVFTATDDQIESIAIDFLDYNTPK